MHTLAQLRAGQLAGATRLDLSAGLTEFPREIFELADTLEVLNLSGNALSDLPDDLPRLHRLKVVFASGNRFTTLPEVLGQCPTLSMVGFKTNQIDQVPANSLPMSLRWLILTDNRIERLPDTLGHCTALEKLALAGNRLRALPDTMAACRHLALARLSANAFESFPDWLFTLPRLTWLALAGNPALPEPPPTTAPGASALSGIEWNALSLHEVLGQGASGVIHRADWRHEGRVQPVAVKLFKGEVTSDGWPHSEMAASLGAGRHPGLIPVLGR
ncbi:MAG TPA: leucine-rich repeat-containing protein kinase family protein, partial [Aquabacterium sp.]|nr:leucine-rich repeat-containing protein kinase family protein [Aquabacterium sp.]